MITADGIALYLVARSMGRVEPRLRVIRRLLWFTVVFCTLLPMAVCRFDLVVMTWTFAAAIACESGSGFLGGILGGTGTLLKIVPGVAVVPSLVNELASYRKGLFGMLGFLGSIALGSMLWFEVGGVQVALSLGYHIERGIEIGSLYAGGLLVAAAVSHVPVEIQYLHHCNELLTPWSESVAKVALPLQAIALGFVVRRAYRSRGSEPIRNSLAAILAFVVFGKVLSPQYLLWMIPLFACLTGRMGAQSRRLFFVACIATTMIFPLGFHWMIELRSWAVGLLFYRNLLLLKIWFDLTFGPAFTPEPEFIRGEIGGGENQVEANFAIRSVLSPEEVARVTMATTLTNHSGLM